MSNSEGVELSGLLCVHCACMYSMCALLVVVAYFVYTILWQVLASSVDYKLFK